MPERKSPEDRRATRNAAARDQRTSEDAKRPAPSGFPVDLHPQPPVKKRA